MPDEQPQKQTKKSKRGFFKLFRSRFKDEPQTREEIVALLRSSLRKGLLDADALAMMEGALHVSELRASDLMVQRAQIEAVDLSEKKENWLPKLIARGHSRFPVVDGDLDTVKGIMHAKDLLRLLLDPDYDLASHLRPARFIPETLPINILLRDFRDSRNHLALVIDEFGSVSGLITIEDVIEQVVGQINDEFDSVSSDVDNIAVVDAEHWRIKAGTHLEQFNAYFQCNLQDDYCETVGGLITDRFEHVPHRGEVIEIEGFRFRVLKGDERQAALFLAEKVVAAEKAEAKSREGNS